LLKFNRNLILNLTEMDEEKEPLKDFNDDIEVKNCIFAPLTMT
jgi:hypothetical protein